MHPKLQIMIVAVAFLVVVENGYSQKDTLYFANDEWVCGELKSLEQNIIKFSTDYDDSDFSIEWSKVKKIQTANMFYVALSKGAHYYGKLKTVSDSSIQISYNDSILLTIGHESIVRILTYKQTFADRISLEIDFGWGYVKSKNLSQLNTSNLIEYTTRKWRTQFTLSSLINLQDDAGDIRRTESVFTFEYILYKNWYLIPSATYFSNTEQLLKYRWNGNFGVGMYFLQTNKASGGIKAGINRNLESFTDSLADNQSWEGLAGININLFNTGDLELFFECTAYPGITDKGRWRMDSYFRIKYELPYDFYLKQDFFSKLRQRLG